VAREWVRINSDEMLATHLLDHRIVTGNECWEWTRARRYGYGELWYPHLKRAIGVHRLAAYLWLDFDLLSPLNILHTCDNPPCFNPAHLFPGTDLDNVRDAVAKGRGFRPPVGIGERNGRAKLTEQAVAEIRARLQDGTRGIQQRLAEEYGVSKSAINFIATGGTWKH
jgi:hypothetical protein